MAIPSAHGHATSSTDMALKSPTRQPAWPVQKRNVPSATRASVGTKILPSRSAMACRVAGLPRASSTAASSLSTCRAVPGAVASIRKVASCEAMPPRTESPGLLTTAKGSPLTGASEMKPMPLRTMPSTGTTSPGRTSTRSPGRTVATSAIRSRPLSSSSRQVFMEVAQRRAAINAEDRLRAPIALPRL